MAAVVEQLRAKLAAVEARVASLEAGAPAAPAPASAGGDDALFHHGFEARPPPKSHASTDLVACQRDSMLRTLTATVVACVEKPKAAAADAAQPGGKKKKKKKKGGAPKEPDRWLVQLDDTVLFPEGGGQPADTGTIAPDGGSPVAVDYVYRDPEGSVQHVAAAPLEVGAAVTVTVDWDRRYDHMQQHSSQHLISALALRSHDIKTLSWELGSSSVTVELDVDSATEEGAAALAEVEVATNEAIQQRVPVVWHEYTREQLAADSGSEALRASAKSLPDEVKSVRIVEIEGIDLNPCCGTHVPNTASLQMVKFMRSEPLKGGRTLLHFASGTRVLDALAASVLRDRGLNKLLCCAPEEYVAKVEKLSTDNTSATRAAKKANEELAALIGEKLAGEAVEGVVSMHRSEADMVFLQAVAAAVNAKTAEAGAPPLVMLLSCGVCTKKGGEGKFLVVSDGRTDAINKEVAAALDGRGGGRGGTMQGKSASLTPEKLEAAAVLLRAVA